MSLSGLQGKERLLFDPYIYMSKMSIYMTNAGFIVLALRRTDI